MGALTQRNDSVMGVATKGFRRDIVSAKCVFDVVDVVH
jgi:hypothetical protein